MQLATFVKEILLNAKDVRTFALEELHDLLFVLLAFQRVIVGLIDAEDARVVAHHFDTVGTCLGLVLRTKLEMPVNVVDIDQYGNDGYQTPSVVDE